MSLWMERLSELHCQELLREAEQCRLARLALEGRQPKPFSSALSWLRSRLSAWGKRLQARSDLAMTGLPPAGKPEDAPLARGVWQ